MQRKLESILNIPGTIEWNLNNYNCKHHNDNTPCDIHVDTSKSTTGTINHTNFNYIVNNYEACCIRMPSRKNKLLQYCATLNSSNKGNDYIKVDKHIIFKIGYSFVTYALLLYINQLSLDTDYKRWGMLYFINLHIFLPFFT